MRPGPRSLVAVGIVLTAIACGQSGDAPAASPQGPAATTATTPAGAAPSGGAPTPGDHGATPTSDAGRTITADDDGDVVVLSVGDQVELVQADPLSPDPVVTGDAVELVEFVNVTGSTSREWEIRALAPGTAEVAVPDTGGTFRITIEVR